MSGKKAELKEDPILTILDLAINDCNRYCQAEGLFRSALTAKNILLPSPPDGHKVFISGPMTGYKYHNYHYFNVIENFLHRAGYKCVNPAKIGEKYNPDEVDKNKQLYKEMEEEIQAAEKTCDIILLLPGWENSKGVRLELKTALELDMKIVLWKN